ILEWASKFDAIGPVFVVHGDETQSTGLAAKFREMGVDGAAPKRNDTFTIKGDRVKPGAVPKLDAKPAAPAAVDK
ncbi:MAG: MBL fold metallo-hydrolase RNA specificity domain-containing protein, partial [Fimbriiglobus sp.]